MFKNLFKVAVLSGMLGAMAFGQQALSSTTLSSAVTSVNAKSVVLASVTAVTIPGVPNGTTLGGPVSPFSYEFLYVDREMMRVTGISGSTVLVQRGASGTRATTHNSGAVVYVVHGSQLASVDLSGSCSVNGSMTLPQINPATGAIFNCVSAGANGSVWAAYSATVDIPTVGAVITGAATIAPTASVSHVTAFTGIATITVPSGFPVGGTITLIPDGAYTTVTGGNISKASTAVTNQAMIMVWDGVKWNASY